MSKVAGIDLGTTKSVVSVMQGGEPVVTTISDGTRALPSVVAVSKTGERLVGMLAKRQTIVNPKNSRNELNT
jgi:molecular chaperone DnaK